MKFTTSLRISMGLVFGGLFFCAGSTAMAQEQFSVSDTDTRILDQVNGKYREAEKCLAKNNYEEAEKLYRELVILRPSDGLAYSKLAFVLEKEGKTEEALSAYRTLVLAGSWEVSGMGNFIARRPDILMNFVLLSLSSPNGRWSQAVDIYNKTLTIKNITPVDNLPLPDVTFVANKRTPVLLQAMARVIRSLTLAKDGKIEDAIQDCRLAVKLAPEQPITGVLTV